MCRRISEKENTFKSNFTYFFYSFDFFYIESFIVYLKSFFNKKNKNMSFISTH